MPPGRRRSICLQRASSELAQLAGASGEARQRADEALPEEAGQLFLAESAELSDGTGEAGREPVQRDTFYQPIKVWGEASPTTAERTAKKSAVLEENLATG